MTESADGQQEHKTLKRIEHHLRDQPAADTILNIFKSVLATAPFSGGIASLITDYIPNARFLRLEQFAEDTAQDLKRLQGQIDTKHITSDSFAFMFEKCFRGAAEHYQQEKLRAFRAILVNSAIRQDLAEEVKEYFLNLVGSLSVLHIRILRFLARPRSYLVDAGIPEESVQGGFTNMFKSAMPGVEIDVIKSAFGDLFRIGFTSTDASIFSTMTSGQGLHLLGNRVNPLGQSFIEFCTVSK